jgi:hypothetical protein
MSEGATGDGYKLGALVYTNEGLDPTKDLKFFN